ARPTPVAALLRNGDAPGRRQLTCRDEAAWPPEARDDHALSGGVPPGLTARVPPGSLPAPPSAARITAPHLDQFSPSQPRQSARFPAPRSACSGNVPPYSSP